MYPDRGDRKGKIPKGTKFEDLPDDWKCPVCGASRKMFRTARRARVREGGGPLKGISSVKDLLWL